MLGAPDPGAFRAELRKAAAIAGVWTLLGSLAAVGILCLAGVTTCSLG
jgi:hypothetical protein